MLDADEVEAIAQRVVELLQPTEPDLGWVRVEVVCRRFGVSPTWVYAHAKELGGIRLGTGPKARLRFDLDRCRAAIEEMARPTPSGNRRPPRRTRVAPSPDSVELIRGRSGR